MLVARRYLLEHPGECKDPSHGGLSSHGGKKIKSGRPLEHGGIACIVAFLGPEKFAPQWAHRTEGTASNPPGQFAGQLFQEEKRPCARCCGDAKAATIFF